jgi:glucan-binding YG repeat protein
LTTTTTTETAAPVQVIRKLGGETSKKPKKEKKKKAKRQRAAKKTVAPAVAGVTINTPETCDLSKGEWVFDNASYPLYREEECSFLTSQVTCMRNGRRDDNYQKWRWQPSGCDMPRYAGCSMLFPFNQAIVVGRDRRQAVGDLRTCMRN